MRNPCSLALAALLMSLFGAPTAKAQLVERSLFSPLPNLPAAGFNWHGTYAGLHGGYARSGADDVSPAQGGFFGGVQGGYNLQIAGSAASAVFGIELEASYLWRQTSRPATESVTIAPHWLGAAKVRSGVVIGRFLPFATAGLAVIHREETGNSSDGLGWQIGYLLGGGVEYAVTDSVSIKVEYDYYQLGKTPGSDPLEFLRTRSLTTQTLKAGANIHF